MGQAWTLDIDVAAPPDEVWAVVGDLYAVPRFYPKYVRVDMEGDIRTLTNAEGGELVERITERDEARRFYSYEIVSGAPVRTHRASFEVVPSGGGGSKIVWSTESEPLDPAMDMKERLTGTQSDALARLKEIVEGG